MMLDVIYKVINANRPIEGAGIRLINHKDGTEICRADMVQGPDSTQGKDKSQQPHWVNIQVMDSNCYLYTLTVWASGDPKPTGTKLG